MEAGWVVGGILVLADLTVVCLEGKCVVLTILSGELRFDGFVGVWAA